MKQLQKLTWQRGSLDIDSIVDFKIKICCNDFFNNVWLPSIRADIPEYSQTMRHLTDNGGIILCPDCIIERLTEFCVAP